MYWMGHRISREEEEEDIRGRNSLQNNNYTRVIKQVNSNKISTLKHNATLGLLILQPWPISYS